MLFNSNSLIFMHLVMLGNCCMQTAEPATTIAPVTTTTRCSACSLATITLEGLDVGALPIGAQPVVPVPMQNCNTLTVTCTAIGNGLAFMEFNQGIGAPVRNTPVISVELTCNANGAWEFNDNVNPVMVITKVACASSE